MTLLHADPTTPVEDMINLLLTCHDWFVRWISTDGTLCSGKIGYTGKRIRGGLLVLIVDQPHMLVDNHWHPLQRHGHIVSQEEIIIPHRARMNKFSDDDMIVVQGPTNQGFSVILIPALPLFLLE